MKISLTSGDTRISEEIQEDFELIDPNDFNEPFKFFHKMIRTKHYKRIMKANEPNTFVEKQEEEFNFELIKDQSDYYTLYKENYSELAAFIQLVDFNLFENLKTKLRTNYQMELDRKNRREKNNGSNYTNDIELMIEEFKLMIDVLSDMYRRGDLYNLMDAENSNNICKFDIKHNKMQDMMISFFLSKLFGSVNKISSRLIHDFIITLASRTARVNISTWTLFLPEFEFFNIRNWIGQKVESLVFSKLFKKQRNQIKFLFTRLNQMIQDHISELENSIRMLFTDSKPVDYKTYEVYIEILNAKYEEINSIKFPKENNQRLNINDICRITDIDVNKEIENVQMEQMVGEIDEKLLDYGEFNLTNKRTSSLQDKTYDSKDTEELFFRSTDCNLSKEIKGFTLVGEDSKTKYDSVNNFQLIDFADGEICS